MDNKLKELYGELIEAIEAIERQKEREEFRQWAEDIKQRQEKLIEELKQDKMSELDAKEAYLNAAEHERLYRYKPSFFERLWNKIRGGK